MLNKYQNYIFNLIILAIYNYFSKKCGLQIYYLPLDRIFIIKTFIMYSRFLAIIFVLMFLASCGGKGKKEAIQLNTQNDTVGQSGYLSKGKMDIPEMGKIKLVEDSGYPFAAITIEFPERNFSESFTINLEEVKSVTFSERNTHIGKYVKFTYNSETSYALLDVFVDSRSVFGSELAPEGEGIKSIEGILHGADEVTPGDLPDEVMITASDGENLSFQFFVTPELVSVNGKKVTGFYDERTLNSIKSIELVRD